MPDFTGDAARPNDDIVAIPFHGDDLLTTAGPDGQPHVILKPGVEGLGLSYAAQYRKLSGRSWACVAQKAMQLPGDTQRRDYVIADVRTFLMLLATVDEKRVAETVRPKLVAYQAEVADVIADYWGKGGAINPRATEDQLAAVINLAERRVRLLRAADGIVDPAWLEAKTRHEIARGLGEEPEVDPTTRPLTVGEYLEDRGIKGKEARSLGSRLGKQIKARFRQVHGRDPLSVDRFVDGAMRSVAGYTERDRPLFDAAWLALGYADSDGAA